MKTVGIIGGSGFIGSHTTKKFLEEGYHVKASTVDISKPEDYSHLKELPNAENLEIVALKVQNEQELRSFVLGCDSIVHCGTPFKLDVEDAENELFEPTIKGTENLLNIINGTPTIKKVVFVASTAALNTNFPMPPGENTPDDPFDESNPPFMNEESHPYAKAKFIANQTVEKFINEHPERNFEITSVSPSFVIGKSIYQQESSTSFIFQILFKNNIAPDPYMQMLFDNDVEFALVDVKDVAKGIFQASIKEGLHGKNYLLTSESWKVSDISTMLNNEQPSGTARVIYKNDAAKRDLEMEFNPAVVPLTEFSEV